MKAAIFFLIFTGSILLSNNSEAGQGILSGSTSVSDTAAGLMPLVDENPSETAAHIILDEYIEAIGGREKLLEVEDRITYMTGTVQGFHIKMKVYQKVPSFYRQETTASGFDQIIIFNGEKGVMITGGETLPLPQEELMKIRLDASLHFLLYPDSAGVKMQLVDSLEIDGTPVYKVRSVADSLEWFTYYDMKNKLRILEEREVETSSGIFKQEILFSDYRERGGLKYPFEIRQKLGSQEINISVTIIRTNQDLSDDLFKIE